MEYDPRDYDATFNGEADDLPAFQAMHADMPSVGGVVIMQAGMVWLSDTWRISKPIQLRGIGNTVRNYSGFRVAPGRTALRLDGSQTSLDGNSSVRHRISNLDLNSSMLIHGSAFGSDLGRGIHNEGTANTTIKLGECLIAAAEGDPTRYYRATAITANGGKGPGTLLKTPAWPLTPGTTVIDNGITWTTEAFPVVRKSSTHYNSGDQVWATKDNRFVYVCEISGTSAAFPPSEMAGGDLAAGQPIDGIVIDGTVTWRIRVAAGILINSGNGLVENLYISGFTGPAVIAVGGMGQINSPTVNTDVNCFTVRDIFAEYCGVGMYTSGDNCNGWIVSGLFVINIGTLTPTPEEVVAASYTNLGGHGFHDNSMAGGIVTGFYVQTSTGRSVLKNGIGRTTFLSCYAEMEAEGRGHAYCTNGHTTVIGGALPFIPSSGPIIMLDAINLGQGLAEHDDTKPVPLRATLSLRDGHSLYAFSALEPGAVDTYAWRYGDANTPPGWWGLTHGSQAPGTAIMLSDASAGLDPLPGWACFPSGYLLGATTSSMLFRGPQAFILDCRLRCGLRRTGDQFTDATTVTTVTTDGYRAPVWTRDSNMDAGYAPWGISASTIEPTAGSQVWRCTTTGTTGTKEPGWPGAPIPDVTAIPDGTVVWTYVGPTAIMSTASLITGGVGVLAMNDIDQIPGGEVTKFATIRTTGIITGIRDVIMPTVTDESARQWTANNICTGPFSLNFRCVDGMSVFVTNGKTAIILVDSRGVVRVTGDI